MLYDQALAYMVERAIPEHAAVQAGLRLTENARDADPTFCATAGILWPYHDEDGQPIGFERVRYMTPPEVGGVRKKRLRYQQPKGTAPQVYLPRLGANWRAILDDPTQSIIITEGEAKSLSVMWNTLIPTLGLGGVYMFADNKMTLPTLERTVWARRKVYIVFDSDIDTKVGVQLAEARLAQWLLRQRAIVHTVRLPSGQNGEKQGADDFVALHGGEALTVLLQTTRSLSDIDMRVLDLNQEVAYLDAEEKIIELGTGNMIRKDSFTQGSRYSTLRAPVQSGDKIKMAPVASVWLTHPMATRYTDTLFLPGGDEVVQRAEGTYLNTWHEQPCYEGDVTLFLDLTRFVFGNELGAEWDWPVKLLAYKAQNQTRKVPLAIMLVGEQGSGKSLWAKFALAAFGKYGKAKSGRDLGQDWNGFLEQALVTLIDDVSTKQMRGSIETLKNWISEPTVERHEKFMKNRDVDNFSLMLFTANAKDAAAFSHDDRRFLVIGVPKREQGSAYYDPMYAWLRSGHAGPHIYHYLLRYDLRGWEPPIAAPATAEKRMAHEESLSPFERLARDMVRSSAHVVVQWLQMAEQWALSVISTPGHPDTPRANEIITAIGAFPIRPWYTAEELCNMFPHMLSELQYSTRHISNATLPGKVSTQLRNNGIYFLKNADDPAGFMWRGRCQQFLIVCPSAPYPKSMTQATFDAAMSEMGTYKPGTRR